MIFLSSLHVLSVFPWDGIQLQRQRSYIIKFSSLIHFNETAVLARRWEKTRRVVWQKSRARLIFNAMPNHLVTDCFAQSNTRDRTFLVVYFVTWTTWALSAEKWCSLMGIINKYWAESIEWGAKKNKKISVNYFLATRVCVKSAGSFKFRCM